MSDNHFVLATEDMIRKAIAQSREDMPAVSNIFDAFEELLVARVLVRDQLPPVDRSSLPAIDAERFRQGVPLLDSDSIPISRGQVQKAADRLFPAMIEGFPTIAGKIGQLHEALRNGAVPDRDLIKWVFMGGEDSLNALASTLDMEAPLIRFLLSQVIRPGLERIAEAVGPLPEGIQWLKGYCPVCGSWPGLSSITEEDGRRRLRCHQCSYSWTFTRVCCPFCDNEDQDKLELIYSEDRPFERAELCHECSHYILGIDVRDRTEEPVWDVIALRLSYLDILAQEKGFIPGGAPAVPNQ